MIMRLPRYARLAYRLAKDDRLTPTQRATVGVGAAYVLSPVDPIPGFIPVLGQLDCLAVVLLTLRRALRECPPEIAREHLEATGLAMEDLDSDLRTIPKTLLWIGFAAEGLATRVQAKLKANAANISKRPTGDSVGT
jgi:uncharacterized membrane protein YkvA (DUF1232 family)